VIDSDNSSRQPSPDTNSGNGENDIDDSINCCSANAADCSVNGLELGAGGQVIWSRCRTIAWR